MTDTRGPTAAYGKRKPVRARARVEAFRLLRLAGKRPVDRGFPDYLEFFPGVRDEIEFTDLSTRVATYFGDTALPVYLPGARFALQPEQMPFFEPSFVRDPGWVKDRPAGRRHLVIHRVTPSACAEMARSREPFTVVDPRVHSLSELEYFAMRNQTTWPTYPPAETALARIKAAAGGSRSAFILATGPSGATVDVETVDADLRITCNSAVRDIERIRAFRPNIIACTDPVFHFGPSRYAARFRRDLRRAAEEVDALVLCGHDYVGPLLGMVPELEHRLAVLPMQAGGPFRWPTRANPTLRRATSVLTNLMLPVALMAADDIAIAGADGRQPTETYFWKHNAQLQYSAELMDTVFGAHPAFFRDRDYADYYDGYCTDLAALIRLGEEAGKTIRPVSPSWIPALVERGAPEPQPMG